MKAVKRLGLGAAGLVSMVALVLPGASASAGAAAATERPLGRIDTLHMISADTNLVIYGAYQLSGLGATFNQERMPSYISQSVLPYVRIHDGDRHTYHFVCRVDTSGPSGTNTVYRFNDGGTITTVTLQRGAQTLEFWFTRDLDNPNGGGAYWALDNISGHIWTWVGCDVYEVLG